MSTDVNIKHTQNKIIVLEDKIKELEDELEYVKRFDTYSNQSVITTIKNEIHDIQKHIVFLNAMVKMNEH